MHTARRCKLPSGVFAVTMVTAIIKPTAAVAAAVAAALPVTGASFRTLMPAAKN